MSTASVKPGTGAEVNVVVKKDWAARKPKDVPFEDTVMPQSTTEAWAKIYGIVGAKTEDVQEEVRLALYSYCAKNGTSREGNYEGIVTTKGGLKVPAAVLPRVVTRMHLRRFMRANMKESYEALKDSGTLLEDDRFMTASVNDGVPPEAYMAQCDWLRGCPLMTPVETMHNERLFVMRRDAATASRGGTLEGIENKRAEAVQGVQASQGDDSSGGGQAIW